MKKKQENHNSRNKGRDTVLLEHGSGGALSRELVESIIYPLFSSADYPELTDASPIDLPSPAFMTTDTYTVQPVFFPGGDIGKLAVCGTSNDLAVSGAQVRYFSLGLVIEEGFPLSHVEEILRSVLSASEEVGASVVTGDTKVVPRGMGGGIYINTCGIGKPMGEVLPNPKRIIPGDRIMVSGPVGSHGIALLAARENLSPSANISSDLAHLLPLCEELITMKEDLRFMRDATRGGVAAVLNEITAGKGFGISLEESGIPILEEVRALSEILGLNPLEVANEGVLIAVVSPSRAEEALQRMHNHPLGEKAAIIGEVREDHPGKVVLKTEIGGKRILGFPRGLLLPRIC